MAREVIKPTKINYFIVWIISNLVMIHLQALLLWGLIFIVHDSWLSVIPHIPYMTAVAVVYMIAIFTSWPIKWDWMKKHEATD